jgi:recombination protein RecA
LAEIGDGFGAGGACSVKAVGENFFRSYISHMYNKQFDSSHALLPRKACGEQGIGWSLEQVAGRLVEISGSGATAPLTLAFGLVLQAQHQNEPVAWITRNDSLFYPPDAAEGGVDLDALTIIRVPDLPASAGQAGARAAARAADQLIRSGAFGLVVLDLGVKPDLPTPLQTRLTGLANKHQTALLCLTVKEDEAPSLGPLVSLRVAAWRKRLADGRFACGLTVLKDKRRGQTWRHMEVCCGPVGLC